MNAEYGGIISNDSDNKPRTGKTEKKLEKNELQGSLNSVGEEVSLVTTTLTSILIHFRAPHVIDYLSLDVNGGELSVLENFDFGL
jgi:hypothetical protein